MLMHTPNRWLVVFALLLGGCADVGYYAQSVNGQLQMWRKTQPIDRVILSPDTSPALKTRLSTVLQMREFACRELHLPDNDSYRSYADLERPYVVWNVFAAPELSTELKTWCFPLVGCVSYRGYFSKEQAERFAAGLRQQGYDTYVTGVPAYSTLGWFDDPVLNTFIHYSETSLAGLIFHELAHQKLYVRDDSMFNESFATAVEMEGLRRWYAASGSGERMATYETARRRKSEFVDLVLGYRDSLQELYASAASDAEKRGSKAQILHGLRESYEQLREAWGGYAGYDGWFADEPNNAKLACVAAYTRLVPAFQSLLVQHDNDLARFYAAVRELGGLPKPQRDARLKECMATSARIVDGSLRPGGS
jgi:predicted aminopeptidase